MKKSIINKVNNIKKYSAMGVGSVALLLSNVSTGMCAGCSFYEPKMPKCLYNK